MRTRERDNYTNKKEENGKAFLMKHWKLIYPEAKSIKWVTAKSLQVKGVDFIVTRKDETCFTVDLKACKGIDYGMKIQDYNEIPPRYFETFKGIPIELFAYNRGYKEWQFTNTKRKKTDEMLYLIDDCDGIGYVRLSYHEIKTASHEHVTSTCYKRNTFVGKYSIHMSSEGSAYYIKYPVKLIYINNERQ